MIEYSGFIYRNKKNNIYMENCFPKNLSAFGKTEEEALKSLKTAIRIAKAKESFA